MNTITIQIGNSDDKLTQYQWSNFVEDVRVAIRNHEALFHFSGGSASDMEWQNYCFVVELDDELLNSLRNKLRSVCEKYEQDSIAWTQGETEMIEMVAR